MGTHFGSLGSKEQNGDPGIPNIFRLSFRKSKKHNGDPDIPNVILACKLSLNRGFACLIGIRGAFGSSLCWSWWMGYLLSKTWMWLYKSGEAKHCGAKIKVISFQPGWLSKRMLCARLTWGTITTNLWRNVGNIHQQISRQTPLSSQWNSTSQAAKHDSRNL